MTDDPQSIGSLLPCLGPIPAEAPEHHHRCVSPTNEGKRCLKVATHLDPLTYRWTCDLHRSKQPLTAELRPSPAESTDGPATSAPHHHRCLCLTDQGNRCLAVATSFDYVRDRWTCNLHRATDAAQPPTPPPQKLATPLDPPVQPPH